MNSENKLINDALMRDEQLYGKKCHICQVFEYYCRCVINKDMSDYKSRLKSELQELGDKTAKLASFLDTKTYTDLSQESRDLLKRQHKAMTEYFSILRHRILIDE